MTVAYRPEQRPPEMPHSLGAERMSPRDKLQTFRDLQKATDNEHGMAFVKSADGFACVAIRSLDGKNVITVRSALSRSQFGEVLENMLPIPETRSMLYDLGMAYANRTPIMLEGGTAIGKTYAVNRFAELLYGPNAKIPDFYCNGQTDVSELMGKYVPAGLKPEQLVRIHDYLKSPAGAALQADMSKHGAFTQQDLVERAALELKLPVQKGSFTFQLGVLPKAMTGTMSPEGIMRETSDGPGCMLHIQEVGMAAPSVVNALLKIRGEKGKLATDIQVHEDGGRLIEAGDGFFLVLSTNPPGKGFKERFEVDNALARALVWKTLPDQLSAASMSKIGSMIFDCSKVTRRSDSSGAIVDLSKHPELADLLGEAALKFHQLFSDKLKDGEPGRKQKVPVTIDSLWKVAEILQNHQVPNETYSGVDFVATLKAAIQSIYIDALRDKPDSFDSRSLSAASQGQQSLGALLMGQLDSILTNRQVEEISFEGKKMTRKDAIEILGERAMQAGEIPAAVAEQAEAAQAEAQTAGQEMQLRAALGDLGTTLAENELLKRVTSALGMGATKITGVGKGESARTNAPQKQRGTAA